MESSGESPCTGSCLVHLHSASGLGWLLRRVCPFRQYLCPDGIPRFLFTQDNNHPALISPLEIIALHFMHKKATYERSHGGTARHIIVVLPAIINSPFYQSQLFVAAAAAGIDILFFIERSVLAALSYQALSPGHRTVLVFELGDHFLEISLLTDAGDGHLNVKAAVSDLGCPLFNYMVSELPRRLGIDIRGDAGALVRIRAACERAKDALCSDLGTTAKVKFREQGRAVEIPIKRELLVEMNLNHLRSGIMTCLVKAGVGQEEVDEIVLAGASTCLPQVRGVLREFFGRQPCRCSIDPATLIDCSTSEYLNAVCATFNIPVLAVTILNFGLFSI